MFNIFPTLKDYCYGDRGYTKAWGKWYRVVALDDQCLSQRKSQAWNNRTTKGMWT